MTDYRKELAETAKRMTRPGYGILAADESTGTIGKKFAQINLENNQLNRQKYRELLLTAPNLNKYISGVILFDETARDTTKDGKPFIQLLNELTIIPGIKVDQGLQVLHNTDDETWTAGLDTLDKRTKEYYAMGCRFAKWRAVLKIDQNGCPTEQAIHENAWGLARYAAICQMNGLVPIVEPEILSDGAHSIDVSQKVTEKVNQAVFKALADNNVFFEGMLLKPNMVMPGSTNEFRKTCTPEEIGHRTVLAMSRSVVPSCVGIMFLSGGQSEEEASLNLNAMNSLKETRRPWVLSFSYGRALQNTCIKTWNGDDANWEVAQQALIVRCKANTEAQQGKYGGSQDASGKESLFIADYKY